MVDDLFEYRGDEVECCTGCNYENIPLMKIESTYGQRAGETWYV